MDEDTASADLLKAIEEQCMVASTKPVLVFIDKTEKKALYIAYLNTQKTPKETADQNLAKKGWELHYTDQLKTEIEARYKTDKPFYSLLSLAMSMIKLIMDKKPQSQKTFKEQINKMASLFASISN